MERLPHSRLRIVSVSHESNVVPMPDATESSSAINSLATNRRPLKKTPEQVKQDFINALNAKRETKRFDMGMNSVRRSSRQQAPSMLRTPLSMTALDEEEDDDIDNGGSTDRIVVASDAGRVRRTTMQSASAPALLRKSTLTQSDEDLGRSLAKLDFAESCEKGENSSSGSAFDGGIGLMRRSDTCPEVILRTIEETDVEEKEEGKPISTRMVRVPSWKTPPSGSASPTGLLSPPSVRTMPFDKRMLMTNASAVSRQRARADSTGSSGGLNPEVAKALSVLREHKKQQQHIQSPDTSTGPPNTLLRETQSSSPRELSVQLPPPQTLCRSLPSSPREGATTSTDLPLGITAVMQSAAAAQYRAESQNQNSILKLSSSPLPPVQQ